MRAALLLAALLSASCAPAPTSPRPPAAATDLAARRQALRALIAEEWEHRLQATPELASALGDRRYADRWHDYSDAAERAEIAVARGFAARLRAIDTTGFPEQERLDQALLLRTLDLRVAGERFESWLMPVTQHTGVHTDLPQIGASLRFETAADYAAYVARLRAVPTVLAQLTANMRLGLGKGIVPPRVVLEKVAEQAAAVIAPPPAESAFAVPLAAFPPGIAEPERARIRAEVLAAIREQITPAYAAFAAFVRDEYAPRGRADVGEWALPLGAERYQLDIAANTTTTMTAEEIHALGLREVARLEGEMNAVARRLGAADMHALAAAVARDPARRYASRAAILADYRGHLERIAPKLPALFAHLPKQPVEVVPIEEFRESGAASANYEPGAPDGSRPGRVHINTGDFATRTMLSTETTAYHEGVPGHHLQIALAQELQGLPPFRQNYFVTAYTEGWALYAERLGEELGLYQDPYSYYGHLQDEMLRAIRLVVDTGLHAKHWTRQQVVDYFHAHSTSDEVEVQSETDRYIADPGQALGYKIGQLRILELRAHAQQVLGPRFDVGGFHDAILGAGALPLDVLAARVEAWIAASR